MTRRSSVAVFTAGGAPSAANEDLPLVGDRWAAVIDGAGRYPGVDNGCVHEVTWFVSQLGAHLRLALLAEPERDLPHVLARAIAGAAGEHGPGCDLTHPLSPGATVALVRERDDRVEWLVLGDATVVVQRSDRTADAITDDRLEHLPDAPVTDRPVRTYEPSYVATWRNQPGGFWVASARPEAAHQALTGSLAATDVRRVLLCSDGVARLVERYGYEWADLFDDRGSDRGLALLVDRVRQAELSDPDPRRWRGKRHDDATAVLLNFVDDRREDAEERRA